jgi:Uma2 family endonuclease
MRYVHSLLIAEVLSDSTKNYDRGEKFKFYRTIPTFQEYILIDQYEVHVEQFYFDSEKRWIFVEYNEVNDILKLNTVDVGVPLRDIYRRVEIAKRIVKGE